MDALLMHADKWSPTFRAQKPSNQGEGDNKSLDAGVVDTLTSYA